jgi:ABC-type transport system substrate-binding protein
MSKPTRRRENMAGLKPRTSIFSIPIFILMAGLLSVSLLGGVPVVDASDFVKVGLIEEPKTLNFWLASDTWSKKVLRQIYQPLYVYEPKKLELVPWLAESMPVFDSDKLVCTVKLRKAKWSDGTPFTANDVAFTASVIKDLRDSRRYYMWKFVEEVEVVDDQTVRFHLKEPMAIFRERTLTTSIVQKKQWAPIVEAAKKTEKPLATLRNHKMEDPIGTGPFTLSEWKKGAYIFMKKNKHFFAQNKQIGGFKLGPNIDGIIFKVFGTSDAAIMAIKKGDIDMFWWGIQPGYIQELEEHPKIKLYTSERSALYFLGFNLRKPPFNDAALRKAIACLVDRDFIMLRVLQGSGTKMTSIVPPGNVFWHCKEKPDHAAKKVSSNERIKTAYGLLKKAGYSWETPPVTAAGEVVRGEGIHLPDGSPMEEFTVLTPPADYDPARAMAGVLIQEWLRAAGFPVSAKPMAFSSLLDKVKGVHDFDMFVLGYGRLSLDPDYLRSFFHSSNDKRRGWNMSGYKNPEYDKLADASAREMDPDERRKLILEMQRIIMRDIPYLPLYNPHLVEAVREDKIKGWVPMLEGIGNTWSFCTIGPN